MSREPKIDRQREHQANERTFLAWVRTSIALIGFGFAIARFGLFVHELQRTLTPQVPPSDTWLNSENLGISLVVFGIVIIALAAWRYNQVLNQIERGDYRPQPLTIWIVTVVVMILGTMSIPLLVIRSRLPNPAPSIPPQSRPTNR